VWLLCLWLRMASGKAFDRRAQSVSLAVVILILLPAISITDDLMATQNPAEVDCSMRRDHDGASPHSIAPLAAALPLPAFTGLSIAIVRMAAPSSPFAPFMKPPAVASIQNRPPPAF
jgi:hypothetical protein